MPLTKSEADIYIYQKYLKPVFLSIKKSFRFVCVCQIHKGYFVVNKLVVHVCFKALIILVLHIVYQKFLSF